MTNQTTTTEANALFGEFTTSRAAKNAVDAITKVTVEARGNANFRYTAHFQDGSTLVIRKKATRQYKAAWWHILEPWNKKGTLVIHLKLGKAADPYCREKLYKAVPCQLDNA